MLLFLLHSHHESSGCPQHFSDRHTPWLLYGRVDQHNSPFGRSRSMVVYRSSQSCFGIHCDGRSSQYHYFTSRIFLHGIVSFCPHRLRRSKPLQVDGNKAMHRLNSSFYAKKKNCHKETWRAAWRFFVVQNALAS